MTRIIRQNTPLTAEERQQYAPLVKEYDDLFGLNMRTRRWGIASKHYPTFMNAGHGSTFEGFLEAKREVIADVRRLIWA